MDTTTEKRSGKKELRLARHRRTLTALLLCMAVLLPVLSLIAPDRDYSPAENRSLAQGPALTLDSLRSGAFFTGLSDYMADQLWARDSWISLDTLGLRLMGRRDVSGVYLGRDRHLLAAPETPDETRAAAKLEAVNGFAARHEDLNLMLMLVPDGATALSDKLPAHAPVRDQTEDIEAVRRGLSPAVRFLDAARPLREHRQEEIYYRTDHHWTTLGAYYAFAASEDAFDPEGRGIPAYDVLTASEDFEGTLASRSGVHRALDAIQVYLPRNGPDYYVYYPDSQTRVTSLYRADALEEKDQYALFFGGNHPLAEVWTTVDSGRSLLVFKDSYANCFLPFLLPYYDSIILVDPRYYYGDLSTVLASYEITDVLFLYSADTWMTDAALADLLATDGP